MTAEELKRWIEETNSKLILESEDYNERNDLVSENGPYVRLRTISKNYYDDEILYKDEYGIHLKPGIHRLSYNTHIKPEEFETHINDIDLKIQKRRKKANELYTKEDGVTEY